MKVYHFALLFLIFFLCNIIKTDALIGRLKEFEKEKGEIESSLITAVSDVADYLAETGPYGTGTINKNEALTTFFASLYSSLGIISDKSAQAEIEIYIPVILLCDIDGYYVYYFNEHEAEDGNIYIERIWSEKMPYSYEDDYFIYRFTLNNMVYIYDKHNILNHGDRFLYVDYKEYAKNPAYKEPELKYKDCILFNENSFETVKKTAIINRLEEVMAYYTSRHNHIASRQGITYSFLFPYGTENEWANYIDDVCLLVVFQGYPYGPDKNYIYNKVISAGANILKRSRYYVEEKSWYKLAHRQGCEKITESTLLLEETFDSIEECVGLGAYCCECIEHGARVPVLEWE